MKTVLAKFFWPAVMAVCVSGFIFYLIKAVEMNMARLS